MAQESVLRIVIDSRNAERNARNIANELQNIERNGDHASRSMDSMSVATRSLVGYMGGLVTIGAAISKMDAYTGLQNRLKLVTDSQAELNTAMNDTFAIAQKTASSWDSTAMVYQRFADNADRLGISMKQTAALTETVSKAISVSGGSAASAEAALMQFGQALASGVLRGEEFNSIAEQAPGLLKAIAMGMDTNIGSLRAMAAEGKITGDELVKALSKAKPYIDDLFNKTDFTIAQSFTQLSNEVTKFVGAAGAGSGAAAGLSAAISGLANNLSTIANIAVIGGVALLTKTIAAQTVAIYGSITASVARRSTLLAELAAQAAASTAEVARTGAIAQFTAMQLVDAKATAARMTGIQRLAYVQATVIPLEAKATQMTAAHTTATAADTVVQNANNAARSRGAMLLRMIGGPIGALTIGVTALAAGYMYLKSRTAEANAKLEEQGKIAQETDAELRKLSGNDKISAVRDLTAAFNAQNETLAKSKESVDAVLFSIRAVSVENEAARKVTEDARNGVISYDEAIKRLNQMDIPTDLYDQLKKQVFQYNENAEKAGESQRALAALGKVVQLAGNLFQNSAVQVAKNTDELNKNESAANAAADAQSKYISNLQKGAAQTIMTNKLIAKGWEIERAKMASQAAFENGGKVSAKDIQIIDMNIAANKKLQASEDAIANAKRGSAKAASAALSQHRKDAKEANRIDEEQRNLREQYIYAYADREKQIELNLAKEIEEIHKANFTNPEPYLEAANKRAYYEKQIYLSQLQFEINEFQMSEEQKLKYSYDIKNLQLHQNSEITKESKEIAINALEEQYNQELALIKLSQETRLFQMREQFLNETVAMEQRYDLEHRKLIEIKDVKEREYKAEMLRLQKMSEIQQRLKNASQNWASIQADMNGTSELLRLSDERDYRAQQSGELADAEYQSLAQKAQDPNANMEELAAQREAIWQEHHDRMIAIESDYYTNSQALQLAGMGQIASGLSSIVGDMAGEQSSAYKAMFAIEKGFAIAQSALAIQTGVSKAIALGFPQNIPVIAQTVMEGAKIASAIRAITDTGFANGGYTGHGGKYEPAGVVHKGEGVLTQEEVKALGGPQGFEDLRKSIRRGYATGGLVTDTHRVGMGAVSAINSGGGNGSGSGDVNITVNVTDSGVTTQSNQSDQKQLGQMIGNAVRTVIRQEQRQGGLLSK